jgi:hypothetical protein
MRKFLFVLTAALISLALGTPAGAEPTPPPAPTPGAVPGPTVASMQVTIQGRPAVLRAVQGKDADAALDRIAKLNSAPVGPEATNPCFGAGVLCLFQNINGGGSIDAFTKAFLFQPGPWNLTNDPLGGGTWNDQMSSWGNDIGGDAGAATMCWWVDINRTGAGHLMRPLGAGIQNVLPSENDKASSVDTKTSACH